MSDDLANGDVARGVRVRAGSKHGSRDGEIHSRRDNTRANEVHGAAMQARKGARRGAPVVPADAEAFGLP